ncbi:uncharacterized protein F5147DRAFT_772234 [Suillus discolor]|uniref:HIT-type domain-containing protein n=1 Tax=Suillus discolor TaxID=1912936 RepID=A0A9P7JVP1_9AGAM|nr:uncharacterized protein F5147DRAFT_772234 [Suillus discolor]KAG2110973.1 hypothetical protein F5147DRAFT_772234 [Suillus discolor]
MAPKRAREQAPRHVNATKQTLPSDIIIKRTKRHLEELERSNYTEPSITFDDNDEGAISGKNRVRQVVSDKRHLNDPNAKKKKSSMKVRTALLYRKNLATLIEESRIASLPCHVPTYLTAAAPPPQLPPRLLCSVCGYKGAYKCKKCAMPYCDINCQGVHAETRCERRVI